ncbi:MAG: hypothetical protein A3K76_05370 [Euryarchaeota archaeon RBG_13_57_23]|nr:MAG: hypothetical protein A3K76_05370 [Euryarchaeota archaeon RBG_13_57_23]
MSGPGCRVARGVEVLPGGAALLTEENVLVVADMHLGVEAALEYEGLSIPRVQTKKIEEYLAKTIRAVSPSKVVVAGDLKHNFSRNLVQEWEDIRRFVKGLSGRTSIEVIKGNHDNYLGSILQEYGVPIRSEMTVSGVRILHGHLGTLDNQITIMGHIHPSIRLRDSIGASLKDRCFLYDKARRVLVLPALSLLAYGTDVVGQPSADKMSPLLSEGGLSDFVPIMFSEKRPLTFPKVGELRADREARLQTYAPIEHKRRGRNRY